MDRELSPGFYPGLTYDEYAGIYAVRHSALKSMAVSPKLYQHRIANPEADKAAYRLGRIVHCATLEPHLYSREYVLAQHAGMKRGPTKEKLEELFAAGEAAARALHADPVAGPLLAAGHREGTVVWIDATTGLKCKARIDSGCFISAGGHLADLKTSSRGIDQSSFGRTAFNLAYHRQLAFYADGAAEVFGGVIPPVRIIAVESGEPFDVVVYEVDEQTLEMGRAAYRELLVKVEACEREGVWPGYAFTSGLAASDGTVLLKLPESAYPQPEGDEWGLGEPA
jgi:hypothetical protein